MSDSIWKKPDQKPERNEDILVEYTSTNGQSYYIVDSYLNELLHPKRWAYLSDIIAHADKAERLQKAVDCALEELQRVAEDENIDWLRAESARTTIDEIKQLIKGGQYK